MNDLYVYVIHQPDLNCKEYDGYRVEEIRDDLLFVYSKEPVELFDRQGFIEEDITGMCEGRTVIFKLGDEFQIIPTDPVNDTAERIEQIKQVFQELQEQL